MATTSEVWPQPLEPVDGPFSEARIDGAAEGMGDHGHATRAVAASGYVPPDLLTGMTLFLLARQPRRPRPAQADTDSDGESGGDSDGGGVAGGGGEKASPIAGGEKASPIAGGVWVREQFTIHRPLPRADRFEVTGASTGRYVHKGRRYGTTRSRSVDAAGRPVTSNLTTGLLSYSADPGLADEVEGLPVDQTPGPEPDWDAATDNPHVEAIRSTAPGTTLGGRPMVITLAMMAARDTAQPDNPIHSDPEEAKRAGLAKPIAGGSHVLAFAIEPLLAAWGPHALHHGTRFDVRWRAPTECDTTIVPTATVTAVEADRAVVDLDVALGDGRVAMVGSLIVPLPV